MHYDDPSLEDTTSGELLALDREAFGAEGEYDVVVATCDICGESEPEPDHDWNGETGNHISCEAEPDPFVVSPIGTIRGDDEFFGLVERSAQGTIDPLITAKRTCPECGRVFDMLDENDSAEWHYGHDCEES